MPPYIRPYIHLDPHPLDFQLAIDRLGGDCERVTDVGGELRHAAPVSGSLAVTCGSWHCWERICRRQGGGSQGACERILLPNQVHYSGAEVSVSTCDGQTGMSGAPFSPTAGERGSGR